MVPVDTQVEGDVESIELRDDNTGEIPDEPDGLEEWFR